jgi:hypothetical protein
MNLSTRKRTFGRRRGARPSSQGHSMKLIAILVSTALIGSASYALAADSKNTSEVRELQLAQMGKMDDKGKMDEKSKMNDKDKMGDKSKMDDKGKMDDKSKMDDKK